MQFVGNQQLVEDGHSVLSQQVLFAVQKTFFDVVEVGQAVDRDHVCI